MNKTKENREVSRFTVRKPRSPGDQTYIVALGRASRHNLKYFMPTTWVRPSMLRLPLKDAPKKPSMAVMARRMAKSDRDERRDKKRAAGAGMSREDVLPGILEAMRPFLPKRFTPQDLMTSCQGHFVLLAEFLRQSKQRWHFTLSRCLEAPRAPRTTKPRKAERPGRTAKAMTRATPAESGKAERTRGTGKDARTEGTGKTEEAEAPQLEVKETPPSLGAAIYAFANCLLRATYSILGF